MTKKGPNDVVKVKMTDYEWDVTQEVIETFAQWAEFDAENAKTKEERERARKRAKLLNEIYVRVEHKTLKKSDLPIIISLIGKYVYGRKDREGFSGLDEEGYGYHILQPYKKAKEKLEEALRKT